VKARVGGPMEGNEAARRGGRLSGPELRRSLVLITIAWGIFGTLWMNAVSGAPFTSFARRLGAGDLLFGVLMAAPLLGVLGHIPSAYLIERLRSRKGVFLWAFVPQRVLWLAVAALPWVIGRGHPSARLGLLAAIVFASSMLSNAGSNAFMSWTADIIPERVRGRYLANRMRLSTVVGVAGAAVAGWALDWNGSMTTYSAIFAIASLLGTTDVLFFFLIPEPRMQHDETVTLRRMLSGPLRDADFRRYLLYSASEGLAFGVVVPIFWLFALEYLALGKFYCNFYLLILPAVMTAVSVPFWGRVTDRYGCRPVILVNTAILILLPVVWIVTTRQWHWLLLVHGVMGGVCGGAVTIADFNLWYRITPAKGRPAYLAVGFIVNGVANGLGPIIGGAMSQALRGFARSVGPLHVTGLHVVFLLSAVLRTIHVLVFAPLLRERGSSGPGRLISDGIIAPAIKALRPPYE